MKDRMVNKQIQQECLRFMYPCFILHFLRELLTLTLPVVSSWMIGSMANDLLTLNMQAVKANLALFLLAFFMDAFVLQAVRLAENMLLTRRGFRYGSAMMERYLYLPMHEAGKVDAATLVKRIGDDTTEYYFYLMQKWTRPVTLTGFLLVLASMIRSEQMHPLFSLVMAGLAAIPLIRAAVLGKQKARLKNRAREYEESRDGLQYGLFHARDFLRGFHLREHYIQHLHQQYEKYREEAGDAQNRLDAADQVFGYVCTYGVSLGVITLGALLIAGGMMSIGALLAGYLIMPTLTQFYEYFEALILGLHNEQKLRGRLAFLYAGSEAAENEKAPASDQLELQSVTFAYPDAEEKVFTDKSLLLDARGHVHIKGKNGSGKSTLLALLAGVDRPQSGHIRDQIGNALSYGVLRDMVALQEQDGQLFSTTIADNLFVPEDQLPAAARLLKSMGMEKPLETMLLENAGNLSLGERKKIILARALMKPSKVLAMDEPLNHLDAQGTKALFAACGQDRRGVLLVSHREFGPDGEHWTEVMLD